MSFKTPYRKECEAELASRKGKDNFVEYEFKDYPGAFTLSYLFHSSAVELTTSLPLLSGTTHGFAARPNLEYPEVKAGFEGAFTQTVEWFKKTLA
jgi:carboxymethylenebutenolidase